MATAVTIDDDTKSQLDTLQAAIKRRTGRELSHEELLTRLVQSAVDSREAFIESLGEPPERLSETELQQFNDGRIASGVETTEDDIDDTLYG